MSELIVPESNAGSFALNPSPSKPSINFYNLKLILYSYGQFWQSIVKENIGRIQGGQILSNLVAKTELNRLDCKIREIHRKSLHNN